MHFTPGERAVLGQIRVLYRTAGREQQMKALMIQWPPTHFDTYRAAYAALVAKALVSDVDSQTYRLTDAGLLAIGVTPAPAPVVRAPEPRPMERKAAPVPQAVAPQPRGVRRVLKTLFG